MTREEFRDYVDFLRSQDEISYDVYSGLIDGIDTLEQEPKTGHWEIMGEEYIQVYDIEGIPSCGDERICSECGFETVFIGEHCSQYKFCPNCGADMRGEEV